MRSTDQTIIASPTALRLLHLSRSIRQIVLSARGGWDKPAEIVAADAVRNDGKACQTGKIAR